MDPERFEKRISSSFFEQLTDTMEESRGKVPFTVVYDKLRLNAYIHSSQLDVPNKTGRLAIRVDSGLRAARGGNETPNRIETSTRVPGLYSLGVQRMGLEIARDERDEPSQALIIEMNHSVIEREMPRAVHAWLLPEKHPDPKVQQRFARAGNAPFPWSQATVTPDILAASPTLPLTQVPGELEHYELHSFRHVAEPGRFVYVKVDKGLASFGGYVLGQSVENILRVPAYPQELRIAQQGSLLSLSGSKTLTVMTRDVAAMRVQIGRLLPRQIQHLVSQTEGTFSAPSFRNWNFDTQDITEQFSDVIRLPQRQARCCELPGGPVGEVSVRRRGRSPRLFFVRVQSWMPSTTGRFRAAPNMNWNGSHHQNMADARLIVLTDLGLLAKRSLDGSQEVFVQSIRSGDPLAEVRVEILGRNGLPVLVRHDGRRGACPLCGPAQFQE